MLRSMCSTGLKAMYATYRDSIFMSQVHKIYAMCNKNFYGPAIINYTCNTLITYRN